MRLPERNELSHAGDVFQRVLDCDALYRTAEELDAAIHHFTVMLPQLPYPARARIELALVYASRNRTRVDAHTALENIVSICTPQQDDVELQIIGKVVRGSLLCMRGGSYQEAREEVEEAHLALRSLDRHFLYGLAAKVLAVILMYLGDHERSEESYQDALSVFRRYSCYGLLTIALNDFAVLKKKMCQYDDAEKLLHRALKMAESRAMVQWQLLASMNLGILGMKKGDWKSAHLHFGNASALREREYGDGVTEAGEATLSFMGETNAEHLLVVQREFDTASRRLAALLERYKAQSHRLRWNILANEFLGELHLETQNYEKASVCLSQAAELAGVALSQSDVMTEILRRQADLECRRGNVDEAIAVAGKCIRLCKKIGDKHELGAVLRVLGEAWEKRGEVRKAAAAFETGIHTLKSIHECYELMRSCIAYGAFLVERGEKDGEVYLMEARQLCKKLEIDFYAAKISVLLARHATNAKTFEEARRYLYEAEDVFGGLQDCDQKQLRPLLKSTTEMLDKAILQASITAARELKTICKVYEEARFPIEEMKPDLAYQVTQSVGAESLFMVRRFKRGYEVPLAYNIPVKEAKEMVRRLDRERGTAPLLGIKNDPKIFELSGGTTMVGVPTQSDEEYVLCTMFREHRSFSPRQLEFLLASAEAMERLAGDRELKRPVMGDGFIEKEDGAPSHPRGSFKDILTIDPEMIKLIHLAERASRSEAPILLEGETGVGKELFARAIHENSPRRDKTFVAINAGGMPVNFLESQLFGHVRGAYTDAANDRIGLVEEARGGTIFFDEIGEMGEELQVKLLRLLENGEFRRLGENRVHHADVRVISATNRDLMKEVERRVFRRDLFYRLGTVKLTVPPLRFRQRDIQLLIRHFLKESAARNRMFDRHFQIDVKAMEALEIYNWPGNVRELHNEMMRIVSLIGDVDMIRFGMLSDAIREYVKLKNRSEGLLEESVERYERRLILDALNRNDWNRLRTAEDVGIPRTTLLAKMKRLNIAAR